MFEFESLIITNSLESDNKWFLYETRIELTPNMRQNFKQSWLMVKFCQLEMC